jgi:hypothetical protein
LILVAFGYGVVVRQEFMDGPYFTIHKMEKRIDPAEGRHWFQQQQVEAMFLPYMVQLVTENLFARGTIELQLIVPENIFQERKRSARLMGTKK